MAVVCIRLWPSFDSTNVRSRLSHTRSSDHFHRVFEFDFFPLFGKWAAILNLRQSLGVGQQFEAGGAFRTEPSA